MRAFSRLVLRFSGTIAFLGTGLAFVGAYYSVQLYKNLRTDFQELLPTTARSVLDLDEVSGRLQSIENLGVLVFSDNTRASKRFVVDLAARLNKYPKNVISSVEYRIDRELQFFKERQALFMDIADLTRIRNYIRERIDYERSLYNPINIFAEELIPEPKLDFDGMRQKYTTKLTVYEHFPDGFYATPDEKKRVVLVYLAGKTGIDQEHTLKKAVVDTVAALKPASYAPDLTVKYTAGVQDAIEEHGALIADLELSTVIVIIVVTLAMLLFYRSARATFALVGSLFMGTFWTFGISYFAVGYLNANSAFLGSIVIGNGINVGVIFLARYLEERRGGRDNDRAITLAMTNTATSTATAALAAGLSYGSLILTGFRGFKQFGVIGLIGMVLCWVSAFTLLPAYLTILDRWRPLVSKPRPARALFAGGVARFVDRYPGWLWAGSFLLTLLAVSTFTRYSTGILETNLVNLRNKESTLHGSAYLSKNLDEIFQHYLSPVVVLPKTREDARRIAASLKEVKERQGKSSLLASISILDDFLPTDQLEKIKLLKQIRSMLPPRLVTRMSASDRKIVSRFLNDAVMKPMREQDLPPMVLQKFTEQNGAVGRMVLVEPPLSNDTWEGPNLVRFITEMRIAADAIAPGTPVAGTLPLTCDMIQSISTDGPRATLFAFLAVVTLVVFLFRDVRTIALVLFSLILGVTWLGGIIMGFWLKINFLNFIALPITFGIGVDYGVNMFQRYREEGGGNILGVIRNTGGAVALCSFTTIVGYSSLLIAGNQGFVSFGLLAVAGELTCVVAAVISLPAFLLLRARRRELVAAAE